MCTVEFLISAGKPENGYSWNNGSYCLPLPSDVDSCGDDMVMEQIPVTAPGRNFSCTSAAFMDQCGNDTFTLKACCPRVLTEDYDDIRDTLDSIHYT